jgi:hypothetical protein
MRDHIQHGTNHPNGLHGHLHCEVSARHVTGQFGLGIEDCCPSVMSKQIYIVLDEIFDRHDEHLDMVAGYIHTT